MKKIIAVLLSCTMLFASNQYLSNIPPATIYYINLNPEVCDTKCLQDLLDNQYYISFLARYDENFANSELKENYNILTTSRPPLNLGLVDARIAVLLPEKVIKSYSIIVTNAIFSYAIRRELNVDIKFFLTGDESPQNINKALLHLQTEGFKYIIAPLTLNGVLTISNPKYSNLIFYVPTINANSTNITNQNIIFGGIDYKDQIERLLYYANNKIAIFYDGSKLGNILNEYILKNNPNAYINELSGNKFNLKHTLRNNNKLKQATIFLNTPLIKTALLSSQFRVYDLDTYALLSTQINYNNALLSLTQPLDRKNMYIANSISTLDEEITSNNDILGQNINYDWVAYSTTFGFDYLYTTYINQDATQLLNESIDGNQVIYNTKIVTADSYGFHILDENNATSSSSSLPTLP